MAFLIATAFACAVFFAVRSVFAGRLNPVAERLDSIAAPREQRSGEETGSLADRLFRPFFDWLAGAAGVFLPSRLARHFETQLIRAGEPIPLAVFLSCLVGIPLLLAGMGLAIVITRASSVSAGAGALAPLAFLGVGLYAPIVWLRGRVSRRQARIERELPDALDLIVVSVEAGLGLEGAMARVWERGGGPVASEFGRVLSDLSLGLGRRRAMQSLVTRTGVPAVGSLVAAILQAEQTGMGIGQVLRAQSEHLRTQRRQAAEEAAMKAPLKMLFPIVLFIFPSLFVVILAPAVLNFLETMGS